MKPETKFRELKSKIVDSFKRKFDCRVNFLEMGIYYTLLCEFDDGNSAIMFDENNLTRVEAYILIREFQYRSYIVIPSEKLAMKYLSEAYKTRAFISYVSLFEKLINEYSAIEISYEYLPTGGFTNLARGFDNFGDIRIHYTLLRNDDMIIHTIYIFKLTKSLKLTVSINGKKTEVKEISLRTVPKVFESVMKYVMSFSNVEEYVRLEEAIRELYDLVNVEKRDIREAIKELVEMHGYGDIFGYQI